MPEIDAAGANIAATRLAIFTGFDGTLVELADDPGAIAVADTLPEALERAARELDSALAVLTDRDIDDIDRYLAPLHLPIAGAHGTLRRRADGTLETADAAAQRGAEAIAEAVEPLVMAHPDLLLQTGNGKVALHFRQTPELETLCRIAMEEAVHHVGDFVLLPGDMVFEAHPGGFTKGTALRAFMAEEPFLGRTPIFIGDDSADEDGFIAAQELGGVGIKLGEGDTAARMRIANVASVHALIRGLGDIAAQGRAAQAH